MTQTETYKKLFRDKFPPQNDQELVYSSIILALSERVDQLESLVAVYDKRFKFIASLLKEMQGEEPEPATAEAPATTAAAAPQADAATAAVEVEIPVPDAQSGPAVNARPNAPGFAPAPTGPVVSAPQPIVKKPQKNGAKDVAS